MLPFLNSGEGRILSQIQLLSEEWNLTPFPFLMFLVDYNCKSFVIWVVFTVHFCSPSDGIVTIFDIGLVKKMALNMSGFINYLNEFSASEELFCRISFFGKEAEVEIANYQ